MNDTGHSVQVFWVAAGSLLSYGCMLGAQMILSRYLPKGDYGTYQQVLYVYNTLLVVFTLGLPRSFSYFLPQIPAAEAKDLIRKITNLFFLLGGVFSGILFLGAPLIASWMKNDELSQAVQLFSPVPFLLLPTLGLDGILATYRKSRWIAVYKSSAGLLQLVFVVVPVVFFRGDYKTAIVAFDIASLFICIGALFLKNLPVRHEVARRSRIAYKQVFGFSLPLLYAGLWGILINSADQLFISRYFGKEVFAEFSNGWIELPLVSMIVGACSVVLMPVFSRIVHEEADPQARIYPLWISVFEKTAKIIYPLVVFCWVFADVIMRVVYGPAYSDSAVFFRIRLVANLFTLIAYAPLILALGATKYYAKVHKYGALVLIAAEFVFVGLLNSPYTIAAVSVVCQIGRILFMLVFIAKFMQMPLSKIFPSECLYRIVFPSVIILFSLRYGLSAAFSFHGLVLLGVAFVGYCCVYGVWAWYIRLGYGTMLRSFLRKMSLVKL